MENNEMQRIRDEILRYLEEEGPKRGEQIAQALGLEAGMLSGVLEGLEDEGLLFCTRKERWALPETLGLLRGRLRLLPIGLHQGRGQKRGHARKRDGALIAPVAHQKAVLIKRRDPAAQLAAADQRHIHRVAHAHLIAQRHLHNAHKHPPYNRTAVLPAKPGRYHFYYNIPEAFVKPLFYKAQRAGLRKGLLRRPARLVGRKRRAGGAIYTA